MYITFLYSCYFINKYFLISIIDCRLVVEISTFAAHIMPIWFMVVPVYPQLLVASIFMAIAVEDSKSLPSSWSLSFWYIVSFVCFFSIVNFMKLCRYGTEMVFLLGIFWFSWIFSIGYNAHFQVKKECTFPSVTLLLSIRFFCWKSLTLSTMLVSLQIIFFI